jgi:post-segregation antitoxin (ccd killing protein)
MRNPADDHRNASLEWREANRQALAASNDWVETHGLPLRAYSLF